jgi:hypothetical protein
MAGVSGCRAAWRRTMSARPAISIAIRRFPQIVVKVVFESDFKRLIA